MVYSMTAFSRYESEYVWGHVSWEIRSLNQRYLDIQVDVPRYLCDLVYVVRKKVKSCLVRGRIECVLQLRMNDDVSINKFNINKLLVLDLIESVKWINSKIDGKKGNIDLLKILLWPGVVTYIRNDLSSVYSELLLCFDKALCNLVQDRLREGLVLKEYIVVRLRKIHEEIDKIGKYIPSVLELKRVKLLDCMKNICAHVDNVRLEQELLIIAQKIDVSEEIDRLVIHLKELYSVISQIGVPIGRKLDFLVQELNREANTLTSKSVNAHMTQLGISLKILIDQIREQIQNIE